MPQEFYPEDEVAKIIQLAAQHQVTGGMNRDALLRSAAEVGISPEAIAAAERQVAAQKADGGLAQEFRKRRRIEFAELLITLGSVSGFLAGIWFVADRDEIFWPIFPIMVFMMAAAIRAPSHLMTESSGYERAFARWKARRLRRKLRELEQDL